MLFSQRIGKKPIKNLVQIDSMDNELRNSLWNCFANTYWKLSELHHSGEFELFFTTLSHNYFKETIDNIQRYSDSKKIFLSGNIGRIKGYFFKCQWYEVLDLVEFTANTFPHIQMNERFINECNIVLEREVSAYRFVNNLLTQITSENEITEIEKAQSNTETLKPVNEHLRRSLELLADRKSPDYRNSIKESISAVESLCNLIDQSKKTLAGALKSIEAKVPLHSALKESFIKLYGYSSDASGIRHALMEESNLDFEDAKFMLVSCSAFVNYLLVKAEKAGIKL